MTRRLWTLCPVAVMLAVLSLPTTVGADTERDDQRDSVGDATLLASSAVGQIARPDELDLVRLDVGERAPWVTVYTTGDLDTVGWLLRAGDGMGLSVIDASDDDGDNKNFRIARYLEPGEYYLAIMGYGEDAGRYVVHLVAEERSARTADQPDPAVVGSRSTAVDRTDSQGAIAPDVERESCPSYPPGFDGSDAAVLAYRFAEENALPLRGQWWEELQAELHDALSAVRRDYPFLSAIHAQMSASPSVLLVELADDLTARITEILDPDSARVTLATGHAEFDALNAELGLRSVGRWGSWGFFFCYHLGLDHDVAISSYSELDGIVSVDLDSYVGDGPDIFVELDGGRWHITFRDAWGDCPAGCLYEELHGFHVENGRVSLLYGGEPREVSEREDGGDPFPVELSVFPPREPARPQLVTPIEFPTNRLEQLLAGEPN